MTHDEYTKKKIALLKHYLHIAVAAEARREEVDSLAKQLADALDRLVLEIDPFEAKPGAPDPGGSANIR